LATGKENRQEKTAKNKEKHRWPWQLPEQGIRMIRAMAEQWTRAMDKTMTIEG
jgi:hypothetical protein